MTFLHVRLDAAGNASVEGAATHRMGTPVPEPAGAANGVFADWHWDGTGVTVRTDPLGFFPLFVFVTDRELCISPSLVTLVDRGAPRDLDHDALAVFLRLGHYLGDATPFASIRVVSPMRTFTWSGDEPVIDPWPRPVGHDALARDTAIDAFVERVHEAVRRRLPPDEEAFDLPLSGGVDSRHILLELIRQRRPPRRVVTGSQHIGDRDITVAARLAARLGIDHVKLGGYLDAGWHAELRKNRGTSFCADEHAWYLPVADHLLSATPLTYDGIGGDVLAGGASLYPGEVSAVASGDFALLFERLAPDHLEPVLAAALTPDFFHSIPRVRAVDHAVAELGRHAGAPNPIGSFSFWNTTRREISLVPHSLLTPLAVHSPFLDCDVVQLLTGLPASMLVDRRFHIDALHRAFPDFATVPFANELPMSPTLRARRRLRQATRGLAQHVGVHARSRHSRLLRRVPPIVRGRVQRGARTGFNWRAIYLRQLEILADGASA